jgi:hypothetical protein
MRLFLRDVKLLVYQWSWKWTHLETKLIPISVVCTFFCLLDFQAAACRHNRHRWGHAPFYQKKKKPSL